MVDTVDILVDRQFNDIQRQDAQLELLSTSTDSGSAISVMPGIARAEPVVQSPVTIERDGKEMMKKVTLRARGDGS